MKSAAILVYLVPCKLRLGVLPSGALLKAHQLEMFEDIVLAIRNCQSKV